MQSRSCISIKFAILVNFFPLFWFLLLDIFKGRKIEFELMNKNVLLLMVGFIYHSEHHTAKEVGSRALK